MPSVLLVSAPYGSLERPALGLGLLQAQLHACGVECDTRYLGFAFADLIGVEEYLWVAAELPHTAFAGDWAFSEALHGSRPEADAAYVDDVLHATWGLDAGDIARLGRIRARAGPFVEYCLAAVPWGDYDVVGFTSTFEQNIASLALARRVKAAHPGVTIAFGGANWEGEMGRELHHRFGFVDVVCSGEADRSFPAVVAALARRDRDAALGLVRGIAFRDRAGRQRTTGPAVPVTDLDALADPDFDAFFRDRAASAAALDLPAVLLVETGRGCWWGARSHCTFCGLNGESMAFRSKSPDRALGEIRRLRDRYATELFSVVDNILDMGYFRTLLPSLAREEPAVSLFWEVKANLSAEQVALLAAAGVRTIQPGLESMSDRVLKLMGKGTTALQNVQLLKWCREHGVRAEWNLLYGFPGERAEDYKRMVGLLRAIAHLEPPSGLGPVRLDRFSPYHVEPAAHGMRAVAPMTPYRVLYPFGDEAVRRIAYYFDYQYADGHDARAHAAPVLAELERWMAAGPTGSLRQVARPGGAMVLVDDRPPSPRRLVSLAGWQAVVYAACDRVRTLAGVLREAEPAAAGAPAVRDFLDWCVAEGLAVRDDERYLALAVHAPPRRWHDRAARAPGGLTRAAA